MSEVPGRDTVDSGPLPEIGSSAGETGGTAGMARFEGAGDTDPSTGTSGGAEATTSVAGSTSIGVSTSFEASSSSGDSVPAESCPGEPIDAGLACGSSPGLTHSEKLDCGFPRPWDIYVVEFVNAGDCVAAHADNGTRGNADLALMIIDAQGYYFEFDDEVECSTPPWNDYQCPSGSVVVRNTGPVAVGVRQVNGFGCSDGAVYSLGVSVNGVDRDISAGPTYDDIGENMLCQ